MNGQKTKISFGTDGWAYSINLRSASAERLRCLFAGRSAKSIVSGKSGFFWKGFVATRVHAVRTVPAETFIDFKIQDDSTFCTAGTAVKNSIANGHIIPWKILFPQGGDASTSAFSTYNLKDWRAHATDEYGKWKADPNRISIMPVPVGHQIIGGEGKALMITAEIKQITEHLCVGMQTPPEIVFGGLSYSGSNVSLRNFYQGLLDHQTALQELGEFMFGRIAAFLGKKAPKFHLKKLKLADDLQRSSLLFNLNQAQKISDRTLLVELDLDLDEEEKNKAYELTKQVQNQRDMQVAMAHVQGEVARTQQHYQLPAPASEQGPGPISGLPEGTKIYDENSATPPAKGIPEEMISPARLAQSQGGHDIYAIAGRAVAALQKQDPQSQALSLQQMAMVNQPLHAIVSRIMDSRKGSQADPMDALQMPLPEQRAPRRQVR